MFRTFVSGYEPERKRTHGNMDVALFHRADHGLFGSASYTEQQKEVAAMAKQDNIDKLEKTGTQCIGDNDLSVFDDIWADDLVAHDPAPGQDPGG